MSAEADSVIVRFYDAFARRDGAAMAACYAPDVRFSDPVFTDLRGARAGAMWRMLTEQGRDLEISLLDHTVEDDRGTARWLARYTFSRTGRRVANDVSASFRFADGLIAEHEDRFDLYRWMSQALGPVGLVLGWTPLLQGRVRATAAASLDRFIEQQR